MTVKNSEDVFDKVDLLHRIYIDTKERLNRFERELKEAKEECLRAGMEHTFGVRSDLQISQLRQERALRLWEQACEDLLIAKEELDEALRREVVRRKFGGLYVADPAA